MVKTLTSAVPFGGAAASIVDIGSTALGDAAAEFGGAISGSLLSQLKLAHQVVHQQGLIRQLLGGSGTLLRSGGGALDDGGYLVDPLGHLGDRGSLGFYRFYDRVYFYRDIFEIELVLSSDSVTFSTTCPPSATAVMDPSISSLVALAASSDLHC